MPNWFARAQLMPVPACTEDGYCRECGEKESHRGTCAWSLMRSGTVWVPQSWPEQVVLLAPTPEEAEVDA